MNVDIKRTLSKGDSSEISNFSSLRSREEHSLSVFSWENFNNLSHFFFETNFQNSVSLIYDERFHVREDETFSVLKVIEETTGGSDDKIYTFLELVGLSFAVSTTHNNTKRLVVIFHYFFCDTEDLQGQFASRRDDDSAGACVVLVEGI